MNGMQSPSVTPKKRAQNRTAASSPLSKASTPDKHGAGFLDDSLRSSAESQETCLVLTPQQEEGEVEVLAYASAAAGEGYTDLLVAESCPLLRWAELRGRQLGLIGQGVRYFGDYSEQEPESFLLMQDLLALHKRGCEGVSVTVLTEDVPFDPAELVGEGGACDLDACHVESDEDWDENDDEEARTERWLLRQDLIAMAKRMDGDEQVTVTVLLDDEEEGVEEVAEALGSVGLHDVEKEYSEEDPDAYLLCRDLENMHRRGVESVEVTVLRDDGLPEVASMIWPVGSGHLDIETHYGDAIDALCQGLQEEGGDAEEKAGWLDDYLLMQDMIALQKAGNHEVSVTCVTEGAPEDVVKLVKAGWEEGGLWEEPSAAVLAVAH